MVLCGQCLSTAPPPESSLHMPINDIVKVESGLVYYGMYRQHYAFTCTDTISMGEGYIELAQPEMDAAAKGFTQNMANNLWKPQLPMCNRKQGFRPQPALL